MVAVYPGWLYSRQDQSLAGEAIWSDDVGGKCQAHLEDRQPDTHTWLRLKGQAAPKPGKGKRGRGGRLPVKKYRTPAVSLPVAILGTTPCILKKWGWSADIRSDLDRKTLAEQPWDSLFVHDDP